MRAYVTVQGPDGRDHELVPGDIIGRLATAALAQSLGADPSGHPSGLRH